MEWIAAIVTNLGITGFIGFVLYLARKAIITRLTKGIQHEYDEKIELLKDDLRAKGEQIQSLRSGALTSLVHRQQILYERQVQAVEELWGGIVKQGYAKNISSMMALFDIEVVEKEATQNVKMREALTLLEKAYTPAKIEPLGVEKIRPFVSPLAWAYYSAYTAIVSYAVGQLKLLQNGLETKFLKTEEVTTLVKVVLPHQTEYIEKYGTGSFYYLLDEIENLLLKEIENTLKGEQNSMDGINTAARIIEKVDAVNSQLNQAELPSSRLFQRKL